MLKDIIEVTTKLIEFVDSFEQSGAKKRESIAKYFSRVSESLKEVAKQLKAGELPYSEVAQLKELAEGLPAAIGEEIGKEQAIELSKLLRKSVGENLENLRNNEEAIRLIQESAGKFDGLAFRVAGYPDPKPPLVKPRVVALILLALVGITTWLFPKIPDIFPKPPRSISKSKPNETPTFHPSPSHPPSVPLNSEKILSDLKAANINYSVAKSAILEWLNNSDHRYLNVAQECLQILQSQQLKGEGADLAKIYYYYLQILGVEELQQDPQIDREKLKESIRKAYNDRNGAGYQSFKEILL